MGRAAPAVSSGGGCVEESLEPSGVHAGAVVLDRERPGEARGPAARLLRRLGSIGHSLGPDAHRSIGAPSSRGGLEGVRHQVPDSPLEAPWTREHSQVSGRPQAEPRRRTGLGSSCFSGRAALLFEDRLQRHRLQRSGEDRSVIPAKGLLGELSRRMQRPFEFITRLRRGPVPHGLGMARPRLEEERPGQLVAEVMGRCERSPGPAGAVPCKLEGGAVAPPRVERGGESGDLFQAAPVREAPATGTRDQAPAGALDDHEVLCGAARGRRSAGSRGVPPAGDRPQSRVDERLVVAVPGVPVGDPAEADEAQAPGRLLPGLPETPFGDLSGGEQELCQGMPGVTHGTQCVVPGGGSSSAPRGLHGATGRRQVGASLFRLRNAALPRGAWRCILDAETGATRRTAPAPGIAPQGL